MDQTVEKVSFCAPDRNYEKGFAYICRDGTTRRWMCHGFLATKESVCLSWFLNTLCQKGDVDLLPAFVHPSFNLFNIFILHQQDYSIHTMLWKIRTPKVKHCYGTKSQNWFNSLSCNWFRWKLIALWDTGKCYGGTCSIFFKNFFLRILWTLAI